MTTRREFLFQGAVGLAAITASSWELPAFASSHFASGQIASGRIPIHQGWTTETETEIKILRPKVRRFTYEIIDSSGQTLPHTLLNEFSFSKDTIESIDHLQIGNLKLGETYQLRVSDDENCLDIREFSALDLNRRSARVALLSCMNDMFWHSQKLMWASVARSKPDLLVLIGDACYVDLEFKDRPEVIWRRQCETRRALALYRLNRLIPMIAVWDDHDYGHNNADGTFPYKVDSLRVFDGVFGSRSRDRRFEGPGASRIAYAFGLRIALMDDRYFRSPCGVPNGTHWGDEQEDFLENHLNNEALPTLLCNGNQFFASHQQGESYQRRQTRAFDRTLERLAKAESPVLFCSGDVHWSEIRKLERMDLGYRTWELTSSSVHSATLPWALNESKDPRRIRASWQHNFILLQTETSVSDPSSLSFRAECIGKHRKYFEFSETLTRA
jgi:phosphodiesterase/alkaline phosphatase D-like protein